MGWKSTVQVSRREAVKLLADFAQMAPLKEVEYVLGAALGDNPALPHHGHNFHLIEDDSERAERSEYERLKKKFEE